jgi:hypothetical protein
MPTPEEDDDGAAVSWALVGGIIGGALVLGLLAYLLISRQRRLSKLSKEDAS